MLTMKTGKARSREEEEEAEREVTVWDEGWACSSCTYLNKASSDVCEMCTAPSTLARFRSESQSPFRGSGESRKDFQKQKAPARHSPPVVFSKWNELPPEVQLHVLSFLGLPDVAACSRASRHMNSLTNDSLLWTALSRRRWGAAAEKLPKRVTDKDFKNTWKKTQDKRTRFKLRHEYLGDWTFGRFTLSSLKLHSPGYRKHLVLEFIEEDGIVVVGDPSQNQIEIWEVSTGTCLATLVLSYTDHINHSTLAGPIQKMVINKYKVVAGYRHGVVMYEVYQVQGTLIWGIRDNSYCFYYKNGYTNKEPSPSTFSTHCIAVSSNAVASIHDNSPYIFLVDGSKDPVTNGFLVTRIALGDNRAEDVIFHLDTIEGSGAKAIRLVVYMKKSRNLHLFHLSHLTATPDHEVMRLADNVGDKPKRLHVSGNRVALVGNNQTFLVNLDTRGLYGTIDTIKTEEPKLDTILLSDKFMEITDKGYIALFNATSQRKVLSNEDFFVDAQKKQTKGNLVRSTYSSARLYPSSILLYCEDGRVILVRFAPTDAAIRNQIQTFSSRMKIRSNFALLGSLAALNPQLYADGNMFLISQLFRTKKELDKVNDNTNTMPAKLDILSNSPIAAILDPAMQTVEEALGFIDRHVILSYIQNQFIELLDVQSSDKQITSLLAEMRRIEADIHQINEGSSEHIIWGAVEELWGAGSSLNDLAKLLSNLQAEPALLSCPTLAARAILLLGLIERNTEDVTLRITSALRLFLKNTVSFHHNLIEVQWTDRQANEAQQRRAVLDRLLQLIKRHSWFKDPELVAELKDICSNLHDGLVAYQKQKLCDKIKFDRSMLTSFETAREKLIELLTFRDLQGTYSGLSTSDIVILDDVIDDVKRSLEQHISLKIVECWNLIRSEQVGERVIELAEELSDITHSCRELLPRQDTDLERRIELMCNAERWVQQDISIDSAIDVEFGVRHAQALMSLLEDSPTKTRVQARKNDLSEVLAKAKQHELNALSKLLDQTDDWTRKQRELFDRISSEQPPVAEELIKLMNAGEIAVMSLGKAKMIPQYVRDDGTVDTEAAIEEIAKKLRDRIKLLNSHHTVQAGWFSLEGNVTKQVDVVIAQLKQTIIDLRVQTWVKRMENASILMASLPLEGLLKLREEFANIRPRDDEPTWYEGEIQKRLHDFMNESIKLHISRSFTATILDNLSRYSAAMEAVEKAESNVVINEPIWLKAQTTKRTAKDELTHLVSYHEKMLSGLMLDQEVSIGIMLVRQIIKVDDLMTSVSIKLKGSSGLSKQIHLIVPHINWLQVVAGDIDTLIAGLVALELPEELEAPCSMATGRATCFMHMIKERVDTLRKILVQVITAELEDVQQKIGQLSELSTKEQLQEAYNLSLQLQKIPDRLASVPQSGEVEAANAQWRALDTRIQDLIRNLFSTMLEVVKNKAMSKSTLYGIEKMKAKLDQSLEMHLLHCRVPTKERSEVENMKQVLDQLIVQRMCMNWFTNASGRAETMLESPDGFNLDAFTQMYQDIELLKVRAKHILDDYVTDILTDLQSRLNNWTEFAWEVTCKTPELAQITSSPPLPELSIIERKIESIEDWCRYMGISQVSIDEQLERISSLRERLETFNFHAHYMGLAKRLDALERKLCSWIQNDRAGFNDIQLHDLEDDVDEGEGEGDQSGTEDEQEPSDHEKGDEV